MKKNEQEIKVVVTYSPGYEERFTEACLKQLAKCQKNGIDIYAESNKKTA